MLNQHQADVRMFNLHQADARMLNLHQADARMLKDRHHAHLPEKTGAEAPVLLLYQLFIYRNTYMSIAVMSSSVSLRTATRAVPSFSITMGGRGRRLYLDDIE